MKNSKAIGNRRNIGTKKNQAINTDIAIKRERVGAAMSITPDINTRENADTVMNTMPDTIMKKNAAVAMNITPDINTRENADTVMNTIRNTIMKENAAVATNITLDIIMMQRGIPVMSLIRWEVMSGRRYIYWRTLDAPIARPRWRRLLTNCRR